MSNERGVGGSSTMNTITLYTKNTQTEAYGNMCTM